MKILELLVKNLQWLIILNAAWGYYGRLEEHNAAVENVRSQIPPLEEQITNLNKKLDQAKIFLANLEVSKKRVQEVAGQIEQVQKQLPNQLNDTEILDFFTTEAQNLNLKVSLSPGSEDLRDFYFAKKYNIKVTGTYLQFMIYFERIGNSERLINIQSLKLNQLTEKQKGRFQILTLDGVLESFRYNPAYREDTGIEKIENEFKAAPAAGRKKRKRKGDNE